MSSDMSSFQTNVSRLDRTLQDTVDVSGRASLMERARRIVTEENSFIYSDEFESLTTERVEADAANSKLFQPPTEEAPVGTPPFLAHLYKTPLLTAKGERLLFRKMNFLRHRCTKLRSKIDVESPDESTLDVIESLAADALETRAQIVECNLRLVVSIARKLRHRLTPFDDLVGEGNLVLLHAVDRFDYSRGFRFSTYATLAIQRQIYRLQAKACAKRRQEPNVKDDFLGDSSCRTESDHKLIRNLERLDVLMCAAPEVLDDREQTVLRGRFGLDRSRPEMTLRELAEDLGISKERVRQVQNEAVDKLFDFAFESGLLMSSV